MLPANIKIKLKAYAAKMQEPVTIVLAAGNHPRRAELEAVLRDVADAGDKIILVSRDEPMLRSSISYLLESAGRDTGIRFSGIPYGGEFTSFVLAILQSSGVPVKLDAELSSKIAGITRHLNFEVFIQLGCEYCLQVVQTLNQFAQLNENITSELIDGDLFPDLVAARQVEGVPSIFLNDARFKEGIATADELLTMLLQKT